MKNYERPVQNLFFMNFYVYILFSLNDNKLYVGQTGNLENRLLEHNSGKIKSTKNRRPLTLIHNEIFLTRSEAMKREKFLKSLYSARFKQKLVRAYLMKNKF
jgi:putative endonuclease